VEGNAIVAADRDGNAERNQFLGLGVQRLGRQRRLRNRRKRLHDLGRTAAQIFQKRTKLIRLPANWSPLFFSWSAAARRTNAAGLRIPAASDMAPARIFIPAHIRLYEYLSIAALLRRRNEKRQCVSSLLCRAGCRPRSPHPKALKPCTVLIEAAAALSSQ
jgi:hypothetical protein